MADTETAEGKMSFLDHLGELRTRIVWSLIPTIIGLLVAFRFSDRILLYCGAPSTRQACSWSPSPPPSPSGRA